MICPYEEIRNAFDINYKKFGGIDGIIFPEKGSNNCIKEECPYWHQIYCRCNRVYKECQ